MRVRRAILAPLLLLAALVSGCGSASPLIVAHRGASHDAPENTLAAFELAWEQDADLIEGDFHLSQDGVVVCHHDATTEETAGHDVPVAEQTLEALRGHDVGTWKDPAFAGERIPTLAEVLATVPPGRGILIEVKTDAAIVAPLLEVIAASALEPGQVGVIAFDADVVAAVKRSRPDLRALWLADFEQDEETRRWTPTVGDLIATARRVGADGVDLQAELAVLDEAFVAAVREAGLELHVWTVNDPDVARRLVVLGVDSITTDRPAWLREQLSSP
jgi:glycerophosphoryl diester phosphodiesterase